MLYLLLGSLSFILFILYDINSTKKMYKFVQAFFFLGCFLLVYATGQLLLSSESSFSLHFLLRIISGLLMLSCALLLIYTLFFALPFKSTYVDQAKGRKVFDQGVYALCRHPGVLWLAGLYFFLWLFTGRHLILLGGLCFSGLNIVYVWLQDRYIFPKHFVDYAAYQKNTPFLLPNLRSINKCITSLKTF